MKLRLIIWLLIVTSFLFRVGRAVRRWIPSARLLDPGIWFLIVTGVLFRIGLAVRRWIPVVLFSGRWEICARLVRSQETYCLLDPGMHDTNVALGGECVGDGTRMVVEGVRVCLGPATVYWPRDVAP